MLVPVLRLEDEIELEVDETKGLELLVVGGVELVDDESELGEGDADEVHEAVEAVARLGRGERGVVDSVGRHGRHLELCRG